MEIRDFKPEDFAIYQGGALGKAIAPRKWYARTHVKTDGYRCSIKSYFEISEKKAGVTAVVKTKKEVVGYTDGEENDRDTFTDLTNIMTKTRN
jgi:hypothetical protein